MTEERSEIPGPFARIDALLGRRDGRRAVRASVGFCAAFLLWVVALSSPILPHALVSEDVMVLPERSLDQNSLLAGARFPELAPSAAFGRPARLFLDEPSGGGVVTLDAEVIGSDIDTGRLILRTLPGARLPSLPGRPLGAELEQPRRSPLAAMLQRWERRL